MRGEPSPQHRTLLNIVTYYFINDIERFINLHLAFAFSYCPTSHTIKPKSETQDSTIAESLRHLRQNVYPPLAYRHFVRSSQKATALAAATLRESTSWSMGIFTV